MKINPVMYERNNMAQRKNQSGNIVFGKRHDKILKATVKDLDKGIIHDLSEAGLDGLATAAALVKLPYSYAKSTIAYEFGKTAKQIKKALKQ